MHDVPSFESIIAETSRLTTSFLHRELELTQTLIELARIEINSDDDRRASQAMNFARKGIATIHRYLPRAPAPDRESVTQQLTLLEHQFGSLCSAYSRMAKPTHRITHSLSNT